MNIIKSKNKHERQYTPNTHSGEYGMVIMMAKL